MIKRFVDLLVILLFLPLLLVIGFLVSFLIKMTSPGPILFWSKRVGKNNILFLMPKFRTMLSNTPCVATHLLENPAQYLTPIGSFLRKTSLDEIPQIWNIFIGDMSFVGPRPALFNQDDLIALRTKNNVHLIRPGLTGWAQINGRDEISIPEKVKLDTEYCQKMSFLFDFKILFLTFLKVLTHKNISH